MFGISLPLITHIVPKRGNVTVVVGSPIAVPKVESPTPAQIGEYQEKYIEALKKLYNDNREKYNEPNTKPELEVI